MLAAKKIAKMMDPDDIRVCLDARLLNDLIEVASGQQHAILERNDRPLGTVWWITILDLADSYHQFPLGQRRSDEDSFLMERSPMDVSSGAIWSEDYDRTHAEAHGETLGTDLE